MRCYVASSGAPGLKVRKCLKGLPKLGFCVPKQADQAHSKNYLGQLVGTLTFGMFFLFGLRVNELLEIEYE